VVQNKSLQIGKVGGTKSKENKKGNNLPETKKALNQLSPLIREQESGVTEVVDLNWCIQGGNHRVRIKSIREGLREGHQNQLSDYCGGDHVKKKGIKGGEAGRNLAAKTVPALLR